MSLPERAISYFMNQYAANWKALTKGNGLQGWMEWLERQDLDEFCFNTAFREICEVRRKQERFCADKDRPRLNEMQAVYFKVLKREHRKTHSESITDDCDFCENHGMRYIVVHADGMRNSEGIITELPATFRKYCYYFTISCSCLRGAEVTAQVMRAGLIPSKPFSQDRQRDLLTRSFNYCGAQSLIKSYNNLIHPGQIPSKDSPFHQIIARIQARIQPKQGEN